MKTKILNILSTVAIVAISVVQGLSQTNGAVCGCPTTRTDVLFSSLANAAGDLTAKNTVLDCSKTYILDNTGINTTGKYYVGKGKSITIAPGTIIKGMPETASAAKNGGVLVVSRGGKIFAAGTESCPIIFTATADVNANGTYGITNKGKWGGVIVLGTATNNLNALNNGGLGVAGLPGVGKIEGFTSPEPRIYFGASSAETDVDFQAYDDNDNSGIMSYVSIRHGGEKIGLDNEINGLTLGSVGRGTSLHHIEVVANLDDGIEFFGGTVDLKYGSVLFNDDDGFDWDLGWSGRGQFWALVKTDQGTASGGDNGFESDGDDNKVGTGIMSNPNVYNATYLGSLGINGNATVKGIGVEMKEQTKGSIRNSIIANYGVGARLADDGTRPGGTDAYDNWFTGSTLKVECNTFVGVTNPLQKFVPAITTPPTAAVTTNYVSTDPEYIKFFTTDGNTTVASLAGFDFTHAMNTTTNAVTDLYDMIPQNNVASTCTTAPVDGFFTPAAYRGAFEAGKKSWLSNYSYNALLDIENGLVPCSTDTNGDGITNGVDLSNLLGQFGLGCD